MTAFRFNTIAVSWLAILLVLSLIGCGAKNVGVLEANQIDDQRMGAGVSLAGFEVTRYNTDGFTDPSLNETLNLSLDNSGNETRLLIGVTDADYTTAVALNVKYDATRIHTERAEFHGLLGGENQVLSGSFLNSAGVAGLAEVAIRDFKPAALDGSFATIVFADGASHTASAAGDVHSNAAGVATTFETAQSGGTQNLFGEFDLAGGTANVYWTAAWHTGDGDQNSETNAADLVPLGANFRATPGTDFATYPADYDENGEVNAADLQRIASFFQEVTHGYHVEAADDDGSGRTPVAIVGWTADMMAPLTPVVPGDLRTAFNFWQVDFTPTSTFNYDTLAALDVDGDGLVTIYVTPVTLNVDTILTRGAEASVTVEVGSDPDPIVESLNVTGYDLVITGAEGGGGDGTLFDTVNTAGSFISNERANFTLNSIWGTYEGVAFTEGNYPTVGIGEDAKTMTQAQYDLVFDAVKANLSWTFGHLGAAGFRRTVDWITFDSAAVSPIIGDPGDATVFPDDDPESVGSEAEGTMSTSLPAAGGPGPGNPYPWDDEGLQVSILTPINIDNIAFDIDTDSAAPMLQSYDVTELPLVVPTMVNIPFTWGSGGEATVLADSQLELIPFSGGVPSGPTISLQYDDSGGDPLSGQFTFRLTGDPLLVQASVPGIQLVPGSDYAFRLQVDGIWSSINLPSDLLPTAPKPPEQPLFTVPSIVSDPIGIIQIFYEDPVIRRNGNITFNDIQGTADPEDPDAYNDALKTNGLEFSMSIDVAAVQRYPVIVVERTDNENDITGPDDPDKKLGANIIDGGRQAGRIQANIQVCVLDPNPGGGDTTWTYKLYNQDDSVVGAGQFVVPQFPLPYGPANGVNWGINVWDREPDPGIAIGDRQYDMFVLNASSSETLVPDIMWVEFTDGWMFDNDGGPLNVQIIIEHDEHPAGDWRMPIDLKVVGIAPSGALIAIHEFVALDYFNPLNPAGGIIKSANSYKVMLDDPRNPGIDHTFTEVMRVVGTPPV